MIKVTPEIRAILSTESTESYGISGSIGGLPRTTYYTPDGRTIKTIPNIREYVKKDKDGHVIETGHRDTNLDKGWLLVKPTVLKLTCKHCGRWHDTPEEIEECGVKSKRFIEVATKKAKQEQSDENTALKERVKDLEDKLNRLLEAQTRRVA